MGSSDPDRLLAIVGAHREAIASGLELDAVMHLVVMQARSLTAADAAVVELVDGNEMVSEVVAGTAEAFPDVRVRRDASLSGMCAALGQVLRSDDTAVDPRVDHKTCLRVGAASMVCVPLRSGDTVTGTLKVYSGESHAFGDPDEQTVELLGGLISARMTHEDRAADDQGLSRRDPLTQLFNRRAYDERLVHEAERARRYEHPLALVLFDLDGFRAINQELGHPAGDQVLREVGLVLAGSRFADAAFRIGGDEFAVLLPETDLAGAEAVGDRLAAQISSVRSGTRQVTASWGAAAGNGDPVLLHKRADMALMSAKFGRGRFEAGPDPLEPGL